ncbi:CPBP family glutamic-type intramembrane protease [Paracoccus amoyensis]|nr:CPBP family glutamic-type intramembrane protease [Paracoccus amoyensis]
MPTNLLFRALAVFSTAGLLLLWLTGGFDWRSLIRGWRRIPWLTVLAIALAVLTSGYVILSLTNPDGLFSTARSRPGLMVMIWLLYPLLSALPQELIFRVLYFHRYRGLLPAHRAGYALNAAIFSFAHLMYWSWLVCAITFVGGWIFARAYVRQGFPSAWLLHAIAGNMLFTVGMGYYFYSGNVVRPF